MNVNRQNTIWVDDIVLRRIKPGRSEALGLISLSVCPNNIDSNGRLHYRRVTNLDFSCVLCGFSVYSFCFRRYSFEIRRRGDRKK